MASDRCSADSEARKAFAAALIGAVETPVWCTGKSSRSQFAVFRDANIRLCSGSESILAHAASAFVLNRGEVSSRHFRLHPSEVVLQTSSSSQPPRDFVPCYPPYRGLDQQHEARQCRSLAASRRGCKNGAPALGFDRGDCMRAIDIHTHVPNPHRAAEPTRRSSRCRDTSVRISAARSRRCMRCTSSSISSP